MSNISGLDIRILNFIFSRLNKYVIWKEKKKRRKLEISWLNLFQKKDYIVHQLADDLKIMLYRDSVLSKLIYRGFETIEIDFLNDFLIEGDYFVDIGANIGLFSLYASRRVGSGGLVIAFEPANQTYNRMLDNIELNGIRNIQTHRLGLSDKEEVLDLNISTDGYEAWNTFVPTTDKKFSLKEMVEVTTLDHFLNENSIDINKISLIKLDVEGFEINVLKGAVGLLTNQDAPVFMIEFTDENAISAGNCCHELYKLLLQYNYSWFTYDATRKALNPELMRLNYPYSNLIAVKNAESNRKISRFI
jgi:FkbM family methyltransferase